MLDAVSRALGSLNGVALDRLPRMADFAKWVVAAESFLPWRRGAFLDSYAGNRESAHELALEASPVAGALRTWFDQRQWKEWKGTATDLLTILGTVMGDAAQKRHDWPKSGRALSGILRRLAPNLRAVGIDLQFDTEGRGNDKRRIIIVRKFGRDTDPIDPTVPDLGGDSQGTDSGGRSSDHGDGTTVGGSPADTPHPRLGKAAENGGDDGDGRIQACPDDDSDQRERDAIMAVEAKAEVLSRGLGRKPKSEGEVGP